MIFLWIALVALLMLVAGIAIVMLNDQDCMMDDFSDK